MLQRTAGLEQRLAPADARFHSIVGCNCITATGVALRDGDFEYEYSLRGDGTVPVKLAELKGARHRYVDCGHSDLPLSDRVIAGTIDLLKTGSTRRFAAKPRIRRTSRTRVSDSELRQRIPGKGRLAAHESRGTQAVPRYAQRAAAPPAAWFDSGPRILAATSREAREPPPGKAGVVSTPAASAVTLTSRPQPPSRGSNHRHR